MKLRALWLPGALLLSANAFATTWTVTSTADTAGSCSSSCTLRAAINSAGAGDTITFANAINGSTIVLTQSSNDTSVGSTEFGPSAFFLTNGAALTIDGSRHGITIARLATQPAFRLFDIDASSSLTLIGLTLRNGLARGGSSFGGGGALGAGGAIFNQGTLAMEECTLAQNAAQGGSGGVGTGSASGGAGVGGDVAGVDGSGPNGAPAGAPPRNAGFGGGGGTAQGTNEPGGNGGFGGGGGNGTAGGGNGGFGGGGGSGSGTNIFVKGNGGFGGGQSGGDADHVSAGGGGAGMGGAIFNDAGSVMLTNVTFYANAAIGGNSAYATLTDGGAGGNGSGYGGAIFNYAGSLTLGFVTLSANGTATGTGGTGGAADGGAIYSHGDSNCGINDGNPCSGGGTATLALLNTIAARSTGAVSDIVIDATNGSSTVDPASAGNLVMTSTGVPTAGIVTHADPQLGSPRPYVATLAPATLPIAQTSPAYNAAASCTADTKGTLATADERGVSRPQFGICDIGAYEYDGDYIFANGFDY